jgi:hypothetical protein
MKGFADTAGCNASANLSSHLLLLLLLRLLHGELLWLAGNFALLPCMLCMTTFLTASLQ